MEKQNLDKGKIKKKVNDQEIEYVNIAENFFEAALQEKDLNKSTIAFGKGLACFVCIYDSRSWWSKHSPFKSIFTGVRPLAKAINKFKNVDSKQTEKASKALNEMLDTLYLTVFRNHSIKAFKSKLETLKLKELLSKINKETIKTAVKDYITNIQKGISDGLKGLKPMFGKDNTCNLQKINVECGKPNLDKGEIKEKVNDQEIEYLNIAENFFEAALQEKSIIAFGKGLACFVCIYYNRSWWSRHSLFKSNLTGIRAVTKAIGKFVSAEKNKKASEAFNKMLDTFSHNHIIKAFKSKLKTPKLEATFSIIEKIKECKKKYVESVKNVVQKLKNKIFDDKECLEELYNGCGSLKAGTEYTLLIPPRPLLFIGKRAIVLLATGGIVAAAAEVCNLIDGIKAVIRVSGREQTKKYLEQYKEALEITVESYVAEVQQGISESYEGLKAMFDKENTDSLQKIKAEFGKT